MSANRLFEQFSDNEPEDSKHRGDDAPRNAGDTLMALLRDVGSGNLTRVFLAFDDGGKITIELPPPADDDEEDDD